MVQDFSWFLIGLVIAFVIPAIFGGWLKFPRNIYLFIYIPVVISFFVAFIVKNDFDFGRLLTHNRYWGIFGGAIATVLVLNNVLSQKPSERRKGFGLFIDITWPGLAYGLTDALFLSVFPVLVTGLIFSDASWAEGWLGRIGLGFLALVASLIITVVYHLGYPEYRNKKIFWTMLGNGIMTLAYIVTLNPLGAILPHMAMHVAAMIHGRETTGQVPPHYERK